jgi:hypothetical protein
MSIQGSKNDDDLAKQTSEILSKWCRYRDPKTTTILQNKHRRPEKNIFRDWTLVTTWGILNGVLTGTYRHKGVKSGTPPDKYVEWDVYINLSAKGIKNPAPLHKRQYMNAGWVTSTQTNEAIVLDCAHVADAYLPCGTTGLLNACSQAKHGRYRRVWQLKQKAAEICAKIDGTDGDCVIASFPTSDASIGSLQSTAGLQIEHPLLYSIHTYLSARHCPFPREMFCGYHLIWR